MNNDKINKFSLQNCSCSSFGSNLQQCDIRNGNCVCKEGYHEVKCDKCGFGYYGYPNCRKCTCDPKGTRLEECSKDLCRCNDDGSCNCKVITIIMLRTQNLIM